MRTATYWRCLVNCEGKVVYSGPHPNLLSVRNTLLNAFKEKISSKTIVSLWRRALKNAKEYFESDENIQLMDEEFDAYVSSDKDHIVWHNIYIISFPISTDNIYKKKNNNYIIKFFLSMLYLMYESFCNGP